MENKVFVDKVFSIHSECSINQSLINITEWANGDGFDIHLTCKNGGIQHMSITYIEFDMLKKMVNKLDTLPFTE